MTLMHSQPRSRLLSTGHPKHVAGASSSGLVRVVQVVCSHGWGLWRRKVGFAKAWGRHSLRLTRFGEGLGVVSRTSAWLSWHPAWYEGVDGDVVGWTWQREKYTFPVLQKAKGVPQSRGTALHIKGSGAIMAYKTVLKTGGAGLLSPLGSRWYDDAQKLLRVWIVTS